MKEKVELGEWSGQRLLQGLEAENGPLAVVEQTAGGDLFHPQNAVEDFSHMQSADDALDYDRAVPDSVQSNRPLSATFAHFLCVSQRITTFSKVLGNSFRPFFGLLESCFP